MTPSQSETACCAHIRVSYQTETLPNFGTHGWWACDACDKRFAPISNTLSDGETVRPIYPEDWANRWSDEMRANPLAMEVAYEFYTQLGPNVRREQAEFYPQQPEEPAPASWWSRVMGWFQ